MIKLRNAALPVAAGAMLLLGGCMTATSYDATSEALKNSPALLADRIDKCTKDYHASSVETTWLRQQMKLASGTEDTKIAATVCRRALTAIADGRMTYDDFMSGFSANPKPVWMRVIQGK